MYHWLNRTELLIGEENIKKLSKAHVLIVGLGGVGGYAAEQICRAGVGRMTIVDGDVVNETNKNRQLIALDSTIDKPKAYILRDRLLDINPNMKITTIDYFLMASMMEELLDGEFDYVVDAIDTVDPKFNLLKHAFLKKHKIVSSMGAGGKFDIEKVQIKDISKTENCYLARAVRKRLNKEKIRKGIKVVFSKEIVDKKYVIIEDGQNKKSNVATISYMPAVFGCLCAQVVITDLIEI
jgi:tRNA A37 threonylcarbamoyladenosine dehydratase